VARWITTASAITARHPRISIRLAPNGYDVAWSVHGVIFAYGVGLVDNALLEPLAAACAEEQRYEFMFMALPLVVVGGTGSPLNPVALF
jgi:hypothetical protein